MESPTAKRGVYPLHGFKLGLYRLPFKLDDPLEIKSIHDGLKKAFEMEIYADRIFATYNWTEENMSNQYDKNYEKVDLNVTVEIVTGEVVDIIYQIWPIDKFGDPHWLKDYRKKADHFAKMVTDTVLRNTILEEKFRAALIKLEKISEKESIKRLEELTPLAMIVLNAKPKPKADPYSKAAKKDSKLGDYVAKRKTLKKGSAEWNANQNKINKAYGVKKRYDETPKPTPTPTPKGKPSDKLQAISPDTKKNKVVVKKETSTKASKLREEGNKVLSDKSLSTEEKQKKALSIRRQYDKQNSKVEKKAKVKTAKVGKIKARANVAEARGNDRRAERLRARAERKETGVSRKDQGRNIFGGKTRKQKKKEAQAKTKAGSAPDFSGMS